MDARHRILGIRYRRRIAGFVVPGLEVCDLGSANAEQDAQNFHAGYPLSELWVEAAAALLDGSEVKAGRVGDRLKEVGVQQVVVGSGNCRVLSHRQRRDRGRESVT